MTDNDNKLIQKARLLIPQEWETARRLASKADTPEAKAALERIAITLYHHEEARIDNV